MSEQEEHKKNINHDVSQQERYFLEGPRSRWVEFKFVVKVIREFIRGFRKLHFVGPCITVFGSARFKEGHPYYELGRDVAKAVVKLGFSVMTGGGPGVMEAANRGAKEAGGKSVGCNIILPYEQMPNPYLDVWVAMDLFFVRKVLLTKYSYAFIVLPGGFGTIDEMFEALTLIQTEKIKRFPIVVMGIDYHSKMYEHLERMAAEQTISAEDMELVLFTDSIDAAMDHLDKCVMENFGLKKKKVYRPIKVLGEKNKG